MSIATKSTPASVAIRINDEPRTVRGGATLAQLVEELGLADRRGVAIAVNNRVVPRLAWPAHALAESDRVLIIRATQGG